MVTQQALLNQLGFSLIRSLDPNERADKGPLYARSLTRSSKTLAVVALQANSGSPASVTSVYSYPYAIEEPTNGYTISNLTFTQQLATVLSTTFLTAAVWLHSNNLTTNGTKVNSAGTLSRIWNALILTAILAFDLATWGQGLSVRQSSQDSLTYPSTIISDRITRILYIILRRVVIFGLQN